MPEPAAPAQGEREESNTQKWIKIGQVRWTNYMQRNDLMTKLAYLQQILLIWTVTQLGMSWLSCMSFFAKKQKLTPSLAFRHR